jgi:hypothetical protein
MTTYPRTVLAMVLVISGGRSAVAVEENVEYVEDIAAWAVEVFSGA